MTTEPHFKFNRELETNEMKFWEKFFENFPCGYNAYFQSVINDLANNPPSSTQLVPIYSSIMECKTNQEMLSIIDKNSWVDVAKKSFHSIIKDLHSILPNSSPPSLFLLAIYGGFIQGWNIGITKQGLTLLDLDNQRAGGLTHVPQLAMVADLMAGRIVEFDPTLELQPVTFKGDYFFDDLRTGIKRMIRVESNNAYSFVNDTQSGCKVSRFKNTKEGNMVPEFTFDSSQNTNEDESTEAPLVLMQESLLKLVRKNYLKTQLENNLPSKPENTNKKPKI